MDLRIFFSTVSYSVRWRNKCGLRSSKKISNKQQQQQRWNICVFKIAASGHLMGLYKCDISFLLLFYGRWKAPTPSRTNRILYQYEYLFWIFKLTICLVGLSNRYVLHEQAILRHCTSHSALCDTFHTTHTTHDTHTRHTTHTHSHIRILQVQTFVHCSIRWRYSTEESGKFCHLHISHLFKDDGRRNETILYEYGRARALTVY